MSEEDEEVKQLQLQAKQFLVTLVIIIIMASNNNFIVNFALKWANKEYIWW